MEARIDTIIVLDSVISSSEFQGYFFIQKLSPVESAC